MFEIHVVNQNAAAYGLHVNYIYFLMLHQARIWNVGNCRLLHTLRGHREAVFCADMDEDVSIVLTGSADRVRVI